ncbi:hypothetical protein BHE74_00055888 [Ensete ventricosum]|nr:hypothetical protein BHE74_00055888 [Ensete ventricosum]
MQCSLISGYFHDFIEERTMMLKVFPDDDLESMAHDRKKEREKGIHMTPTTMMPFISILALPESVFLPSTSPTHGSIVAAAGVDFYTALSLHIVGKFISFLSISSHTILSSPQSQQPALIAATISTAPFFVDSIICRPRCRIPLMPLLSSVPAAQAAVAAAILFLYQPRYCLPPLCRQSCEQDWPGRASPTASPPQS